MKSASNTTDPEVTVSVRQTEKLSAKGKGHPETTAVAYVTRAFERLDLPYRIDRDFHPVAGLPDPRQDKREVNRTWVQRVKVDAVPGVAPGANLQSEPQIPQPAGYEKRDLLSFADDAAEYVRFRRAPGSKKRRPA